MGTTPVINGSTSKYNKQGTRFKIRTRPLSSITRWGILDEEYRSADQFAKKTVSHLRKAFKGEGFMFKKISMQNKPVVIVKKNERIASFRVPFMSKEHFRSFLIELVDKIDISFQEDQKDLNNNE